MSFFRKNPVFAVALTVCAVLVLGELALTYERFAASRAAARMLDERKAELQGMSDLSPPPAREVAATIETDLAKAQAALTSMQGELKGRGPAAERIRSAKAPVARTDAYFDLATFVEKTRELAKKDDVDVRPEAARFGFSAYTNEGPPLDHIEPVFRQRQVAQYLVDSLIEARPRTILGVKRERTLGKAEREARAQAIANGETPPEIGGEEGPDYFTIDPRVTARVPGFIDTMAFRFVFTGQTAALRTFLNQLAAFELPVLVREVEVESATTEETTMQPSTEESPPAEPAATPASAAPSVVLSTDKTVPASKPATKTGPRVSTATPIVAKSFSKFTVTVEFVELVPPSTPPAEPNSPAPATPPNGS